MSPPDPTPHDRRSWSEPTGRSDDPRWLTHGLELGLYLLAGITYVGFGMFHKFVLNWIIGPAWLIVWVWLAPAAIEALRNLGKRQP
jgi:hypothetical protein